MSESEAFPLIKRLSETRRTPRKSATYNKKEMFVIYNGIYSGKGPHEAWKDYLELKEEYQMHSLTSFITRYSQVMKRLKKKISVLSGDKNVLGRSMEQEIQEEEDKMEKLLNLLTPQRIETEDSVTYSFNRPIYKIGIKNRTRILMLQIIRPDLREDIVLEIKSKDIFKKEYCTLINDETSQKPLEVVVQKKREKDKTEEVYWGFSTVDRNEVIQSQLRIKQRKEDETQSNAKKIKKRKDEEKEVESQSNPEIKSKEEDKNETQSEGDVNIQEAQSQDVDVIKENEEDKTEESVNKSNN
jgi:hypothetical protein